MKSQPHKNINWGILGLGKIAHKFAQDLLKIDHTTLYAVASRSLPKAETFAQDYHVDVTYDSYEALAKDSNIDAIYIATPHVFHKAHTILCLTHKKAVLCEKPFAMNRKEVDEMITLAKANNTLLMEAMWTYFLPHFQYALNTIKNETFGKLKTLEADFGFKAKLDVTSRVYNKSLGGGSLLDIGIYPIFAALSVLGQPNDIESKATFFENNVDASCTMNFTYDNGARAQLSSTFLKETPTEAIFYCERGILKINSRFHEPSSVTIISEGKEQTIHFETQGLGYYYEIIHFNELLRAGKTESNLMSFDMSEKLITLLDTVRSQIDLHY